VGEFGNGLVQGALLIVFVGLLVLPYFVWRRPPTYYWRCPRCRQRNQVAASKCPQCEHTVLRDDMRAHVRADWRGRDLIALYLSAQIISLAAGFLLLLAMGRFPLEETTGKDFLDVAREPEVVWLLALLMGATLTVLSTWMLSARYGWPIEEIGLHTRDVGWNVLRGLGAGAAVFAIVLVFTLLGAAVPFFAAEQELLLSQFPAGARDPLWLPILVAMLIVWPLGGELFFRGMLYRMLRSRWDAPRALALTAFLYAIGVDPMAAFLPLLALSVVNSVLFERTHSLIPGIAASATVGGLTAVSVVVGNAPVAG